MIITCKVLDPSRYVMSHTFAAKSSKIYKIFSSLLISLIQISKQIFQELFNQDTTHKESEKRMQYLQLNVTSDFEWLPRGFHSKKHFKLGDSYFKRNVSGNENILLGYCS